METNDETRTAPPRTREGAGHPAAHVARGFAMGAADLVPGVSGGTIALVLGIYERLVGSVRDGARLLARAARLDGPGTRRAFADIEWRLVLPVLLGIGLAIVTLARLLSGLLEDHPITMSALFFGLIVGSVVVTTPDVRRWDPLRVVVAVAAASATFLLLGLRGSPLQDPALINVFAAGVIGICGMVLPGVSGAFILLVIGMYEAALSAIDQRDLVFVAVFGLGAITGLASVGTALKWLFDRYHDTVLAALIGLMAGSLRVLWPWPGHEVGDPALGRPVLTDLPAVLTAAIVATVAVIVLGRFGRPGSAGD